MTDSTETILLENKCCYEFIKTIKDKSVQLFLLDPPYAITKHKWDKKLNWDILWPELWRCLKEDGVILIHSSIPFTIDIVNSQRDHFKYWWTWHKSRKTGFLNSKKMPLRNTEEVCVFYKGKCKYNPQKTNLDRKVFKDNGKVPSKSVGEYKQIKSDYVGYFPTTLQYFPESSITMKPIELEEYFIKTYTDDKDIVCDITMHTGVVGKACKNQKRHFLGCEIDPLFFKMAYEYIFNDVSPSSKRKKKCR